MIVYLKDCNNNLEVAIKRLNRRLLRDGIFDELKRRRHYEKPSDRKRRKNREAAYKNKKKRGELDG